MELYDLFVLAIAAVVFYFIFRIIMTIYYGAKTVANTAKKVTSRFQGKNTVKNPAPAAAPAAPAGEEQALEPMSEAAALLCEEDSISEYFAKLVCIENNALFDYLHENYDCTNINDSHKTLLALCFVLNLFDRLEIGNDPCALKAMIDKITQEDSSYKDYTLKFAWSSGIWKVYMEYKPSEKSDGEAAAMVFVRNLIVLVPQGNNDHLYAYIGQAIKRFNDNVDDVWNA